MNEQERKEVEERFDKLEVKRWVGNKAYISWDIIKDFLHSEIEKAEKKGVIKGARELLERAVKIDNAGYTYDNCNEGSSKCIWELKRIISEMEGEQK